MRKYVNGKLYEMTEEDIAKSKSRFNRRRSTAEYENRIKELENTVTQLLTKLEKTEE